MNPWDIDLMIASKQKQDMWNMLNRQGPYGGSGYDGMRQQYLNRTMGFGGEPNPFEVEQNNRMMQERDKDRQLQKYIAQLRSYQLQPEVRIGGKLTSGPLATYHPSAMSGTRAIF
jgi:hypothetical protein